VFLAIGVAGDQRRPIGQTFFKASISGSPAANGKGIWPRCMMDRSIAMAISKPS
jgi:hypothetical protein